MSRERDFGCTVYAGNRKLTGEKEEQNAKELPLKAGRKEFHTVFEYRGREHSNTDEESTED